ncbi:hypothetical protein GCM10023078_41150 [Gibbsiella greigii]
MLKKHRYYLKISHIFLTGQIAISDGFNLYNTINNKTKMKKADKWKFRKSPFTI